MTKSELLVWLQEEIRKWEDLLTEIDPTRLDQPGVNGDWSMKDIIAHLTGWNHRLVATIQAALMGQPEPPPPWPANLKTDDEVNAWIYTATHTSSTEEILNDTRQLFGQLMATLEKLPEDVRIETVEPAYYLVWLGSQRYPPGEFFDHYHDEHEADVRAWLARGA